ncbi:MAG: sugar 3,4-ketoisomerase [Microbacter sp.]
MKNSKESNSNHSSVYDCTIIELDRHHHEKGNITVVENTKTIPFSIKRIYYLYDVPGGESRGAHAHKELRQLVIAASGSFDVTLDDGNVKRTFTLNRPYQGLLVVPGIWRELNNFSSGSVCLVLASHAYDAADYIREYDEFRTYKHEL